MPTDNTSAPEKDTDSVVNTDDEDLHYVSGVDELEEGDRILVDIEERELAVFNVNGTYHAIANYCTHQGGPLAEGLVSGTFTAAENGELCYDCHDEIVSCPWHGWEFEIASGRAVGHSKYRIPTYDIVVRDDRIYVRL